MPTWLITSASRGLGFRLVQALIASEDNIVFATCRNPEDANKLRSLSESSSERGSLFIIVLNVIDEAFVFVVRGEIESIIGTHGLDYPINNAGVVRIPKVRSEWRSPLTYRVCCIYAPKDDLPSTMDFADLIRTVEANIGGPALVTRMFIPLLE